MTAYVYKIDGSIDTVADVRLIHRNIDINTFSIPPLSDSFEIEDCICTRHHYFDKDVVNVSLQL